MNISTEKKQTQGPGEQTCGCQGRGGGNERDGLGVWGQQMQTIAFGVDSSEILLYSTGNYIQSLMMECDGG